MANNYTMFSFTIRLANKEHADWWRGARSLMYDWDDSDVSRDALFQALGLNPEDFEFSPCSIDVEDDDSEVWIYTEESGDCDATANLVQGFLARFEIENPVYFEAAFTCSKPRPDEFGGAAWFITKDEVKSFGTSQWLMTQLEAAKVQP